MSNRSVKRVVAVTLLAAATSIATFTQVAAAEDRAVRRNPVAVEISDEELANREAALSAEVARLEAGSTHPTGTVAELVAAAREAALLGREDLTESYANEAGKQLTAQLDHVADTSHDLRELLGANRQAQLFGLSDALQEKLSQRAEAVLDDQLSNTLRHSNDPTALLSDARLAEQTGRPAMAEQLTAKASGVASGGAASGIAGGGSSSGGSPSVDGGSGGQSGRDTGDIPVPSGTDGPGHAPGGAGDADDGHSVLPNGATGVEKTGYTVAPRGAGATDGNTTTHSMYISQETYTYTASDGTQHERTVQYDEDGKVTSVDDHEQPRSDDQGGESGCHDSECPDDDSYCVEDGCGNDVEVADVRSLTPPACKYDGCPIGDDSVDTSLFMAQVARGCDPTAYYVDGCGSGSPALGNDLSAAEFVAPTCKIDGCRRPDLGDEPIGGSAPDPGTYSTPFGTGLPWG